MSFAFNFPVLFVREGDKCAIQRQLWLKVESGRAMKNNAINPQYRRLSFLFKPSNLFENHS